MIHFSGFSSNYAAKLKTIFAKSKQNANYKKYSRPM